MLPAAVAAGKVPVVVYESTVYPGVTEDLCAPILEQVSGLTCGKDFFLIEYGRPCVFSSDWLKDYGYAKSPYKIEDGALNFTAGPKGFVFGFGRNPDDKDSLGVRFGAGWKGFDPTSGEVTGNRHIATAVARHPEAVPPVAGSYMGPPNLSPILSVAVRVSALAG